MRKKKTKKPDNKINIYSLKNRTQRKKYQVVLDKKLKLEE